MQRRNAADARQAGAVELKPFAFATRDNQAQHGAFAEAFSEEVPFKTNRIRESLKTEKRFDTLRALYFVDRGRPGSHAKLYEHSAVIAGDSEVLTKEHLRAAFDLRYFANAKFSGFNPFKDQTTPGCLNFPYQSMNPNSMNR